MMEIPMFSSNFSIALLLFFLIWSSELFAECNLDSALNLLSTIHNNHWLLEDKKKIETSEGPGTILEYRTNHGLQRVNKNFCTSYYCLASVSVSSSGLDKTVYFLNWGGGSFPEVNERSIIFVNSLKNEKCLVHHVGGGEIFQNEALKIIEEQKNEQEKRGAKRYLGKN